MFIYKITQLSQQIFPNKAWINAVWEAIHSVTLLFSTDVISAESVDICSTNRAIRLCSALVKSMSWISSQYMKNSSPYVFSSFQKLPMGRQAAGLQLKNGHYIKSENHILGERIYSQAERWDINRTSASLYRKGTLRLSVSSTSKSIPRWKTNKKA